MYHVDVLDDISVGYCKNIIKYTNADKYHYLVTKWDVRYVGSN